MVMMFRSTRGASKQRRDLINGEISQLRDLLPLPESARQRLSQLQIMSLTCVYIRKCNYFTRLFGQSSFQSGSNFDFSQSMTGFLLIATREGKMLYISENVTEYLGHSMVDMMTQGDSLYDIIDKRDHASVQSQLLHSPFTPGAEEERTFFCRMNVARSFRRQAGFGDHKVMHVKGHFMQPVIRDHYGNQPVFMALCNPLVTPDGKETVSPNSTMIFQSIHGLDMKYLELASNGEHHLGFSEVEIFGKSWYELLHPEDVHDAKDKHQQLIKSSHEMGCMLTVRLMARSGEWVWVNTVMHIRQPFICDNGDPAIVCINHVINESDAQHFKVQSQLYSSHIARSPEIFSSSQQGSPPHTITQVSMEQEPSQYQMHYPQIAHHQGSDVSGMVPYADFPLASTPHTTGGGNGSDYRVTPQNTSPTTMSSLSDASFGTDANGRSQKEQKDILHANVIDRIKRKMESGQPQCKPAKLPRYSSSSSDGSPPAPTSFTYTGSLLTSPSIDICGGFGSTSGGGAQVLLPSGQGKVYEQLALKKEVEFVIPKAELTMPSCALRNPPTPPTPAESVGSNDNVPSHITRLTIETTPHTVVVPDSILTPDSTPTTSPSFVYAAQASPGSQEQCVPTLLAELGEIFNAELEKEHIESDTPRLERGLKQLQLKVTPSPERKKSLPELDVLTLEQFFQKVESPLSTMSEQSYLSLPSRVSSINNSPSATNSPLSQASESPAASPRSTTSVDSELTEICDELPMSGMLVTNSCQDDLLNNVQLTVLHAAITDVMGLVHRNTPHNQEPENISPPMDLSVDFMVVPQPSHSSPMQASPAGNSSAMATEDDDDVYILPPVETGHLLDELHQLNELASSTPSYGDEDLTSSLFD